ncbi:MAG: flagellin [Clostridiales bacterium]
MGIVVRTNVMAMNANRQLNQNNTKVGKSIEKLASGFRINRAGDDASGLAISEKMKAQIKGLEQASANSMDGISLVQTAEGALTEVHEMLNRMVTLATKSANGTIQNEVDREAIQGELDALIKEIDRIGDSTNFNGINLIDGNLAAKGTVGKNEIIGGKILDVKNPTVKPGAATDVTKADLSSIDFNETDVINIDGQSITVDWSKMSDEAKAIISGNYDTTANPANPTMTKEIQDKVTKALEEAINSSISASGADVAHVKVSIDDKGVLAIQSGSTKGNAGVSGFDLGTDSVLSTYGFVNSDSEVMGDQEAGMTVAASDEMYIKIGDTKVLVTAGAINSTDNLQAVADMVEAALHEAVTRANTALGSVGTYTAADIEVEVGDDGNLKITNNTGVDISFSDVTGSNLTVRLGLDTPAVNKAMSGGGLTLQVGDTNDAFNKVTVSVENMKSDGLGIKGLDVSTQETAGAAIKTIRGAINKVSTNRANLGALQNRLEYTINNLETTAENMTAANSRIRDTDMAKEMMEYTKMNILTQSAQAMLAQANQQPQSILQLLQ